MSQFTLAFSVFGKRYFFTPKYTLISILIIALLLGLGFWQLQQAKSNMSTIQLINSRLALDPVNQNALDQTADLRFYPIQLQGTFDNDHSILLTNRYFKGTRGYEVLTPFKTTDSSTEILVNRGWIPLTNANTPPAIQPVTDTVSITGILFKPLDHYMIGADFNENNVTWPLYAKRANIAKLSNVLKTDLYPYLILLGPSSPYGFTREWAWLTNNFAPNKDIALARQWFILAFLAIVIFLFINIHRIA